MFSMKVYLCDIEGCYNLFVSMSSQFRQSYEKAKRISRGFQLKQAKIECNNSKTAFKMSTEEIQIHTQSKLQNTDIHLFLNRIRPPKAKLPSSLALISHLPLPQNKTITLQHLKQVGFQSLVYKIKELIAFSVLMLESSQFVKYYLCDKTLYHLVQSIALHYNTVAYHNFTHAFSLCLLSYQCLDREIELKSLYTEEEYFYILIAGLSHDLNHKGTNNSFQIKCNSALAQISHGQSVLQSMHIRTLWKILQQNPDIDFLQFSADKTKAKKIITRLILNTDMAFHFKSLQNFRKLRQNGELDPKNNQQHKWIIMELIFHACDIGNPTLGYENYMSWAALLSFEFNQQAHLQQKMGLEITQSFVYHDLSTLYRDQVGFVGSIVQPIWKEISFYYPSLRIFSDNVQKNLQRVGSEFQKLRR